MLLHQTLLYNDGGFDVSQDGLWLCAIAELWKVVSEPVVLGTSTSEESSSSSSTSSVAVAGAIQMSQAPGGGGSGAMESSLEGNNEEVGDVEKAGHSGAKTKNPELSRDGSGLVKDDDQLSEPLSTSVDPEGSATVAAEVVKTEVVAKNKSGEGQKREFNQEGPFGGRVLKPWPSRAGMCQSSSSGSSGCYRRDGVGPPATVGTGRGGGSSDKGSREAGADATVGVSRPPFSTAAAGTALDAPRTPSPRISLKRRRRPIWLSGGSGGGYSVERKGTLSFARTEEVARRVGAEILKSLPLESGGDGGGYGDVDGKIDSKPADGGPLPQLPSVSAKCDGQEGDGISSTGGHSGGGGTAPASSVVPASTGVDPPSQIISPRVSASPTAEEGPPRSPASRPLRVTLPQKLLPPPSGSPTAESFRDGSDPEMLGGAATATAEDSGRGRQLEPPPLFFLQVPAAGTRREDFALGTPEACQGGREGRRVLRPSAFAGGQGDAKIRRVDAMASAIGRTTVKRVTTGARANLPRPQGSSRGDSVGGMAGRNTNNDSGGDGEAEYPPQSGAPRLDGKGRFVPHLVLVSLHTEGVGGRQAKVVQAAAMDSVSAKQVQNLDVYWLKKDTCSVK